jgi:hypothetical protein
MLTYFNILKFIIQNIFSNTDQIVSIGEKLNAVLESNFPQLRICLRVGRNPLYSLDGVVDAGLQLAQVCLK